MKANELRLGNYVVENSIVTEILQSEFNNVIGINDGFVYLEDNVKPITLTEEWLLKFGFEKIIYDSEETGYGVEYKLAIDEHSTIAIQSDFSFGIEDNEDNDCSVFFSNDIIKYVHRLQNLYFALTDKELKIK